jgi:coproporphyrinogen III oxidase-like Fe-S oxidoreductase
MDGICLDRFVKRFGHSPVELYPQVAAWLREGLMATNSDRLWLTPRGVLVANSIFVHFV